MDWTIRICPSFLVPTTINGIHQQKHIRYLTNSTKQIFFSPSKIQRNPMMIVIVYSSPNFFVYFCRRRHFFWPYSPFRQQKLLTISYTNCKYNHLLTDSFIEWTILWIYQHFYPSDNINLTLKLKSWYSIARDPDNEWESWISCRKLLHLLDADCWRNRWL